MKKIKILQVGNIANNAYIASKFLREEGIESDVLCYNYFHIMGSPEWEDATVEGDHGDDFAPNWNAVNLSGYHRPRWFYQGPVSGFLQHLNSSIIPDSSVRRSQNHQEVSFFSSAYRSAYDYCFGPTISGHTPLHKKAIRLFANLFYVWLNWAKEQLLPPEMRLKRRNLISGLILEFKTYFPHRKDKLTAKDIRPYLNQTETFQPVFEKYDLVQCYATDPIFAMLAKKHPYIAFEHGTIRDIPFENSATGRLTALAYRKADLVFITNSDSLKSVQKLGIKNYVFTPHPLDNYWHLKYRSLKPNKEITLFCPMRHDWKIKGTNIYIEVLPKLIVNTGKPLKLIFLEWGEDVQKSKDLIKKLKLEKYVEWQKPLPRQKLVYNLSKADIILDQLILPAMGGIAPEGMQAGKPVVMSYRHEVSKWMYPEAPPLVTAYNKKEILDKLTKLIKSSKLRQEIGKQGKKWFEKYHSKRVVKRILISNYQKLLNNGRAS